MNSHNTIRMNTLGFLPKGRKQASIASQCSTFSILDASRGTTVFTGRVSGPCKDRDSEHVLWTADFSTLEAQGTYRLRVPGLGESAVFRISHDLYDFPYYTVTRGMYLWRCGMAVSGTHDGIEYSHSECHMEDGIYEAPDKEPIYIEGKGGWHDAGDYNKYTLNAGITVGAMLLAWEHFGATIDAITLDLPDSGGELPDLLAEVKYEIDWLLKMQFEDGSVSHKLTTKRFCPFIMPEAEEGTRYYTDWTSSSTASFVAQTAMTARVLAPYNPNFAERCLGAAIKSYDFLLEHPEDYKGDLTEFHTGGYGAKDSSHRLWAAAELWAATGDARYLADLEARIADLEVLVDVAWDWQNCKNLGLFTYIGTERDGRNDCLYSSVVASVVDAADSLVGQKNASGYARPMGDYYHWGCNGTTARQTITLYLANQYKPSPEYVNTALDAIGYLFGRNPYGRSLVTGLGHNPPRYPHDRRSGADDIAPPWPGYLVGGAWPKATDWQDVEEDFRTNEIAINWNAALIYALAWFTSSQ